VEQPSADAVHGLPADERNARLSSLAVATEQFLQTATVGEFAARLRLLATFEVHARVKVCEMVPRSCQASCCGCLQSSDDCRGVCACRMIFMSDAFHDCKGQRHSRHNPDATEGVLNNMRLYQLIAFAEQAQSDGEAFWGALAAVLANTGRYYRQHLPAVQESLRTGMAPLEKQLEVLALGRCVYRDLAGGRRKTAWTPLCIRVCSFS